MILQQRHCPTKRQHYPTTWRDILHRHFFCKKTFFTRTTKISAFRSNGGKSITWKMYSRYIVYTSMHVILAGPICHVHTRLWAAPEVDKVPWSPSSPPVLPPAGPKNSHPCPATKASAGWDMFNTLLLKNVERPKENSLWQTNFESSLFHAKMKGQFLHYRRSSPIKSRVPWVLTTHVILALSSYIP